MSWLSGLLDRGRIHAVDGNIWCAYRGADIAVEQCFSCDRFLRTGADSTGQWIRCRPDGELHRGPGTNFFLPGH